MIRPLRPEKSSCATCGAAIGPMKGDGWHGSSLMTRCRCGHVLTAYVDGVGERVYDEDAGDA